MAETHLFQHLAMLLLAMYWTKSWLMDPIVSRWRYVVSCLISSILWVAVGWTATRAIDTSSGVTISFSSMPIAYFGAFMAFVSLICLFLGLAMWTEEEGNEATQNLPQQLRQFGD